MNPERWQQVREALDRAIAVSDEERPGFLDRLCSGDSELRAEVESLLHSHEDAGTEFLQKPALDLASDAAHGSKARMGAESGFISSSNRSAKGAWGRSTALSVP